MMRCRTFLGVIVLSLTVVNPSLALDAQSLFKEAKDSVVVVRIYDGKDQEVGGGSGFFVAGNAIATNYHIIANALKIKVEFEFAGTTITQEIKDVLALDPERDLALLYAPLPGKPLPLAKRTPEVGEEVIAIGHPRGLERTLSTGIVSAIRNVEGLTLYQVTTPLAKGSSGGPIIDGHGRVLGVATSGYETLQNLNFAMPAAYVRDAQRSAKKTPFTDARQKARASIKAKRREAKAVPIETASAPTYKIAVFPFAGRFYQGERERIVRSLHAHIKANPSMTLVYSSYDDFLNKPQIKKPQRLWIGNEVQKEPKLELIYQIGQDRELDGIIMYWGGGVMDGAATLPSLSTPVIAHVIDVRRKQIYRKKGTASTNNINTVIKKIFASFIGEGSGTVRTTAPSSSSVVSPSPSTTTTSNGLARLGDAPPPPQGYALLYIYRVNESPRWGRATIYIENERVVRLREKKFTWVHVKQGTYTIRSEWAGNQPDLTFQTTFFKGETYYLKLTEQTETDGGWYRLISKAKSVEEEDAEPEVRACCEYLRAKANLIN